MLSTNADAIDAAVHAVTLLEDDPQFNSGKGAVFTEVGTIELEASIMVSSGKHKRGSSVSLIKHVKNPVKMAAEILKRGETADGGGAHAHVQLSGQQAEELAGSWGLDLCDEDYFWTKKRWDEHKRALDGYEDLLPHAVDEPVDETRAAKSNGVPIRSEYLPEGTVGCVVLDSCGVLAVATSTGGLTNKSAGRIGDTPTFGAGFWAEEWNLADCPGHLAQIPTLPAFQSELWGLLEDLFPFSLISRLVGPTSAALDYERKNLESQSKSSHAVAMSGTGNGDSFLRLCAARSAAALVQFRRSCSLLDAITWMAGSGGQLQQLAGDRWGSGEGEGGIIGIELLSGRKSNVVWNFNCGGMFRAWVDDAGEEHTMVFKEDY